VTRSLDPAMAPVGDTRAFLHLRDIEISENGVYVFDFDGVIVSSLEDQIYKLEPTPVERDLLRAASEKFHIRCGSMDQQYQRHLLYQAAAAHLDIPIEKGPGFAKAKKAAEIARLFVLTARSGWYAIERCRQFLQQNGLFPIETYHVGRVRKDRQIHLVLKEFPDRPVYYIEDSTAHLEDLLQDAEANLNLVFSASSDQAPDFDSLRAHCEDVLARAIAT